MSVAEDISADEFERVFLTPTERKFHASVRGLARFSNVLAIIVVPLVLSVWLTVVKPEWSGALFWGGIAVLAALQIALFALTTQYSETLPELHMDLREQEDLERTLVEQISSLNQLVNWLEAARALGAFWTTAQGLLTLLPMQSDDDLREALRLILNPMIAAANHLFGFDFDDIWSVAVYRFNSDENVLEALWYKRSESHPSDGPPRSWRPGDGHVGSAFMQERILFTVDATSEEASPLLKPSAANERPYDGDAYRSFVSAPVVLGVGTQTKKYGVVVLTSNVAGRFDEENQAIVAQAADVLAHAFKLKDLADGTQAS